MFKGIKYFTWYLAFYKKITNNWVCTNAPSFPNPFYLFILKCCLFILNTSDIYLKQLSVNFVMFIIANFLQDLFKAQFSSVLENPVFPKDATIVVFEKVEKCSRFCPALDFGGVVPSATEFQKPPTPCLQIFQVLPSLPIVLTTCSLLPLSHNFAESYFAG